jgi:hypothetical protein
MIQKRTLTVTYELPEELWEVLEEKAKREGRPMAEVIAEHKQAERYVRPPVSPEEEERLHQELISQFGTYDSGNPNSADNDRIDEDLAKEYGSAL